MKAFPELTTALGEMLDRMDRSLRAGGYAGPGGEHCFWPVA